MRWIAVGLLVMMYPILCKIRFETLHLIFKKREIWVQIAFSIVVNWIVAPLVMVFSPFLSLLYPFPVSLQTSRADKTPASSPYLGPSSPTSQLSAKA